MDEKRPSVSEIKCDCCENSMLSSCFGLYDWRKFNFRRKNLQWEVCVTFAITGNGKTALLNWFNFLPQKIINENLKRSPEEVNFNKNKEYKFESVGIKI